ncbi:glycosyltransferase family 4 protein [Pseudaminobacter sp. 19-2017]|uniref:Glycosyltransferase family 4 protein n=1 Tax=Pseudaminobacter soli (ex Zhang et al. 2022) TaxID=2831468 RepID=A0A942E2Y1_9HYPH|nr:glycosyltransferase family 4 protein [Pseudaminobacter soli]MBS3647547.1 glycosyltransferase family 4 protein [Pseudaminobacter soli]
MLRSLAQPRRILMTVDAVGGVWNYAMTLGRELKRMGMSIVFAGVGPGPSAEQQAQAEAIGTVVWLQTPPDWMTDRPEVLDGLKDELPALVREHAIDLVHLNAPSQAAGLEVPCPVVVISHSCVVTWFHAVLGEPVPDGWRWHEERNRQGFERADAIVAPSTSHAALMQACYGPIARLSAVYNAVEEIASAGEREPIVVAAARWWDNGKNAAVFDEAAANSAWPVRAIGATRGPNGEHVEFRHARATGSIPAFEIRSAFSQAGLFVSPSLYEPFGLAALEAALSSTPLLLADIPTYRELWDGAALFFPPRDAAALSDAINSLAGDPERRRQLGRLAAERARRFSPRSQAAAMAALYQNAVEAVARGR